MSEPEQRLAVYTGGCQCGAIRFAYYAEPVRIGVCHCRMCQRATSSPFVILAEIPHDQFAWTKGTPAMFRSSSRACRDFCADCGSPLSYRVSGGDNIELLVGAFDDPAAIEPTYAVGAESKLPWLDKLHGLPSKTTVQNSGKDHVARLRSFQS